MVTVLLYSTVWRTVTMSSCRMLTISAVLFGFSTVSSNPSILRCLMGFTAVPRCWYSMNSDKKRKKQSIIKLLDVIYSSRSTVNPTLVDLFFQGYTYDKKNNSIRVDSVRSSLLKLFLTAVCSTEFRWRTFCQMRKKIWIDFSSRFSFPRERQMEVSITLTLTAFSVE